MNHVYETSTGKLISSTTLEVKGLRVGLAVKESDKSGTWNASALDFDPRPVTNTISKNAFVGRFTDEESEALLTASKINNNISMFIQKIDFMGTVDMLSPNLIAAVNRMETEGIIGAGRAAEILA